MAYTITYSDRFKAQLRGLDGRDRNNIEKSVNKYLRHQPDMESNKRRRLCPNPLADWELCLRNWRVLYNVYADEVEVVIVVLGKKDRNKFYIDGEETTL